MCSRYRFRLHSLLIKILHGGAQLNCGNFKCSSYFMLLYIILFRLPIVQGGTYTFLAPTFAIMGTRELTNGCYNEVITNGMPAITKQYTPVGLLLEFISYFNEIFPYPTLK